MLVIWNQPHTAPLSNLVITHPICCIKLSGTRSGNKLIKAPPHMWRYHFYPTWYHYFFDITLDPLTILKSVGVHDWNISVTSSEVFGDLWKSLKIFRKRTIVICHTQIWPNEHDVVAISGQWPDIAGHQGSRHSFWLANYKFGYSKVALAYRASLVMGIF